MFSFLFPEVVVTLLKGIRRRLKKHTPGAVVVSVQHMLACTHVHCVCVSVRVPAVQCS